MTIAERPHEEHDVEGFMTPRPQEGTVLDGRAPDDATAHDSETEHAPGTPGAFSSSETSPTDSYDSHATEETGAIIHDDAPEGAGTIAERAAKYLQDLHKEKETKEAATSTALDVTALAEKPTEAPVNEIRGSAEVIALPGVKTGAETSEVSTEPDALSLDELVEEDHSADDTKHTEVADANNTETFSIDDEMLEDNDSVNAAAKEPDTEPEEPAAEPPKTAMKTASDELAPAPTIDTAKPHKKRRRGLVAGIATAAAVVAGAVGLGVVKGGSSTDAAPTTTGPVPMAPGEAPTPQSTSVEVTPPTTEALPADETRNGTKINFSDYVKIPGLTIVQPINIGDLGPNKALYDRAWSTYQRELQPKLENNGTLSAGNLCVRYTDIYKDDASGEKKLVPHYMVRPFVFESGDLTMYYSNTESGMNIFFVQKTPSGETVVTPERENFKVIELGGEPVRSEVRSNSSKDTLITDDQTNPWAFSGSKVALVDTPEHTQAIVASEVTGTTPVDESKLSDSAWLEQEKQDCEDIITKQKNALK